MSLRSGCVRQDHHQLPREGSDRELWRQGALLPPMASFTFLRLSELFEDDNFNSFVHFVARMANETRALGGNDEDKFIGNEMMKPLTQRF